MSVVSNDMSFADMAMPMPILKRLEALNFTTPTPIQIQAIPALMDGKNVLGEAQTGTGKTAAFGLPGLAQIDAKKRATQMLVVAPTRELAIQVADAINDFAVNMRGLEVTTVYGGAAFGPQIKALRGGAQVVVGTPGRLLDLLSKKVLQLDELKLAVLDEADEMLNMGFIDDIETILAAVPKSAQRALFSATMPQAIRKLAKTFLVDQDGNQPVSIQIAAKPREQHTIKQKAWQVNVLNKFTALSRLLETMTYQRVIIFVRTRQDTMSLAEQLQQHGFKASPLSGDLNQTQREQTVNQLRRGHIEILVATDVVARGLDVPEITHVINYDLPGDTESYVHRIGRTGRAGREGEAILFFRPRERHLLRHYERLTNGTIEFFEVPNAKELSAHRQQKMLETVKAEAQQTDVTQLQPFAEKLLAETGLEPTAVIAALLQRHNAQRPLYVKDDPISRRPVDDRRANKRSDRPERSRAERGPRLEVEFETYRIAVGREHGARPQDIVGAIANEAELDSRYIGQIELHDGHSLVELPKGMPTGVVKILQRARVRQQQMGLERVDIQIKRKPRGDRGAPKFDRKPGKFSRDKNSGRGRRVS